MLVQQYPLYDRLAKEVAADQSIDIQQVCGTISNLPANNPHSREIAALIMHHELLTKGTTSATPYGGKLLIGGKGILYTINVLPPTLQHILARYIIHASQ